MPREVGLYRIFIGRQNAAQAFVSDLEVNLQQSHTGVLDQTDSILTQVQVLSSVPSDLQTKSTIAEMRLHPSGR